MLISFRPIALAIAASLAVSACEPTAVNTPASLAQQRQASRQYVQQLSSENEIVRDPALNAYIRGVVARVAQQRPPGAVPITPYIVKSADVNAYTPGGGYLFIDAGMLAALENEAQLATVVAHEIGHIDAGHIQAAKSQRSGVQLGAAAAQILGSAAGINPDLLQLGVGLGASAAVNSFSRTQERQADRLGVRYAAEAGYNEVAGAQAFEVLRRIYGDTGGAAAFFSSHPASGERLQTVTQIARQIGATGGRIGAAEYDRATRALRQDALRYYVQAGRSREAAQIRRNLRGG